MSNSLAISIVALLAPIALQSWLAYLLVHKRLHARFLIFAIYTAFSIVASAARGFYLFEDRSMYAWVYWGTEVPYAALGLAAMGIAFYDAIRPFLCLRWLRIVLPVTVVLMVIMATVHFTLHPPLRETRLFPTIMAANILVRNIQVGIFVVFVLLTGVLHIPRRQYNFGILAGFGVAETGMLLASALRSAFAKQFTFISYYGPAIAYIVAIAAWIRTFYGEEETSSPYGTPSWNVIREVLHYSEGIKRFVK